MFTAGIGHWARDNHQVYRSNWQSKDYCLEWVGAVCVASVSVTVLMYSLVMHFEMCEYLAAHGYSGE